ncbi:MAG TPA: hypothetical protein VFB12_30735 [Ktedonobacteraceae bacterium]|nr:hypothetical protein [Ktedonobacteraceae bacterium]
MIDQVQKTCPDLLEAQARLVLDAQQCAIYLIDIAESCPHSISIAEEESSFLLAR